MRRVSTAIGLALWAGAASATAGELAHAPKAAVDAAKNVAQAASVVAAQQQAAADAAVTPGTTPVAAGPRAAAPTAAVTTPVAKSEDTAPPVGAEGDVPLFGQEAELPASLRENSYFYQSFGTTDPFRSLLGGDFLPKQQELVDLHTVKLVGVVWEPDEIAAMVQDAQGFGYTLRPGDTVKNGSIVSVTQETLVARLSIFGQTTQFTLRLQHEE